MNAFTFWATPRLFCKFGRVPEVAYANLQKERHIATFCINMMNLCQFHSADGSIQFL